MTRQQTIMKYIRQQLPHYGQHTPGILEAMIDELAHEHDIQTVIEHRDDRKTGLKVTFRPLNRTYKAEYAEGGYIITVQPDNTPLARVGVKSDSFSWGYTGSGPSETALSILAHYYGERPASVAAAWRNTRLGQRQPSRAIRHFQDFKRATVALWPQQGDASITTAEISAILATIEKSS